MNSAARSLALRTLNHRREVAGGRLHRPSAAAVIGKKKQPPAARAADCSYSTVGARLAAYREKSEGGYLLVPLVAVGAGTWLVATAATRYLMTPPARHQQGTTTTATANSVEGAGRRPSLTAEVAAAAAAASPSD